MQRHVGSRLPSSGYPALGDGDVTAGTHQSLRSDCVLSTAMEDLSRLSHPPTTDVMLIDPDLDVVRESPTAEGGPATGHQGGGWGGHWPTRTEMPQLTTGKGKETMEPRHIPIAPPPLRERGTKGKKRLNKNPNGHSHNQRNEYKGQGRKPSGHPPS